MGSDPGAIGSTPRDRCGRKTQRRARDAWSYFNGAADFSQMIPEGQRRRLLALSKVRIKPNLVTQRNASTHALGLTRFSVADRLCEREDIRCDGQWNEKHPIVIGQDQILPVHRTISHSRTLQRPVRTYSGTLTASRGPR